jgi:hypothetical protein
MAAAVISVFCGPRRGATVDACAAAGSTRNPGTRRSATARAKQLCIPSFLQESDGDPIRRPGSAARWKAQNRWVPLTHERLGSPWLMRRFCQAKRSHAVARMTSLLRSSEVKNSGIENNLRRRGLGSSRNMFRSSFSNKNCSWNTRAAEHPTK